MRRKGAMTMPRGESSRILQTFFFFSSISYTDLKYLVCTSWLSVLIFEVQ
jgi:hypothetical protein